MTDTTITTRRLGQNGPDVGAIGLGCMGMSWAYIGDADEQRSAATIHHMVDLHADRGVTPLIDTADVYGPFTNEELVGRALAGRRDKVALATKMGIVVDGDPGAGYNAGLMRRDGRPERVAECCEASLRRLGTDHLDLYQLHRIDPEVPVEETWGALAALVERGLVRQIGLSAVTVEEIERAHAIHPVATIQNEVSLWQRTSVDGGVTRWADEKGATVLPYAPLGRGVLTGAVDPANLDPEDFRATAGYLRDEAWEQNRRTVELVGRIGERIGATPAQVALAWVIARAERVVPIPGTTRPERIDENVAAGSIQLDDASLAELDAAGQAVGANPSA